MHPSHPEYRGGCADSGRADARSDPQEEQQLSSAILILTITVPTLLYFAHTGIISWSIIRRSQVAFPKPPRCITRQFWTETKWICVTARKIKVYVMDARGAKWRLPWAPNGANSRRRSWNAPPSECKYFYIRKGSIRPTGR